MKHNKSEQTSETVSEHAQSDNTNKVLLVSDYSQTQLDAHAQKEIITSYFSECEPVTTLIQQQFKEFENADFKEIVAYALKQTFKIENVTSEMFTRAYNTRSSIDLRLNPRAVEVVKADTSEKILNKAVMKLFKAGFTETEIKEKLALKTVTQ